MESRNGLLLRNALDLNFALNAGVHVTLDDLTTDEFRALKIVRYERDCFDRENAK